MYDRSHKPFAKNYDNVVRLLKIIVNGELADPIECEKIAQLPITVLAAGIDTSIEFIQIIEKD
ncbi:MAG: hypothetical protein HUJ42_00430 [Malacoplasma sp.]|nr:hypothetical protein [Malacoplasma sp.]